MMSKKAQKGSHKRDSSIIEVIEGYGYRQKEVADYLGLHYSTISRLIKDNEISKSKA